MGEPFIKLYKKMLKWEWYDDTNTKILFLHCLLKANWESGSWHGIQYEPGQFITSLQTLAVETHLTVKQVRVALRHLKETNEVADFRHGNCRVITIKNWNVYQSNGKPGGRQRADQGQTGGKPGATDKEYKEIEEYKDISVRTFKKPTVEEVRSYCNERHNSVDPEKFVDFYESKGWFIGKNKMKDWKSAVRTWERKDKECPKKTKFSNFEERKYDFAALENEAYGM